MAICKDCIHYEACKDKFAGLYKICVDGPKKHLELRPNVEKICETFKDKSRYIELPCDIGNKVYFIKGFFDYAKQPMCGTVCMIKTFTGRKSWTFGVVMDDENSRERHFVSNDIGKTVFLTREEAEKALKER